MPRLPKKRRAAVAREKLKKQYRNLEDPLSWTFKDPWNSEYLRPPVSTPPSFAGIDQPIPSISTADADENLPDRRSVPESWDPLSWTFEDPWNTEHLRTTVSKPPSIADIVQPIPSISTADAVENFPVQRSVPESLGSIDMDSPTSKF